jgi:hypothetical protein
MNREDIKEFVKWWDNKFTIDFWYRTHYGLKFNTPEHRRLTLFDMAFEFEEILLAREARQNRLDREKREKSIIETNSWLRAPAATDVDVIEAFNKLDISKFKKDG